MSNIRVRKAGGVSVTLSPHLAAVLHVEAGGYVAVEEVTDGVLLKPLPARERREAALEGIHAVQGRVKASPEMQRLNAVAQEDAIAAMLDEEDA